MKICVVGASGGIGRELVRVLSPNHDIAPVFRSRMDHEGRHRTDGYGFDDPAGLSMAIGMAEMTIHAALDTKAKGNAFIPANRALTEEVLSRLDPEHCRLFVYFSSQVVYSALDARRHSPYSEDQTLSVETRIDAYTRLKLDEEDRVRAYCDEKHIPWLIVRPTVVMGPGMQWSSGMVDAMRKLPVGLGGRTINIIHVTDLCLHLQSLIEQGAHNEVFNLGARDVSSADFFAAAAAAAGRRVRILPEWVSDAVGLVMPSTMWFIARDLLIDCAKLRGRSGHQVERALADYFVPLHRHRDAATLEDIATSVRSGQPYQATGQGYSLWFNDRPPINTVSVARYQGVLEHSPRSVTVRAGTTLAQLSSYLDKRGLTLPTLPEFVGVSVGACFFTEVHGSTDSCLALYDLFEAIHYFDAEGNHQVSEGDFRHWEVLRQQTQGIALTDVRLRCVPSHYLSNSIAWQDDDTLDDLVCNRRGENYSTTLHWFPGKKRVLVYSINPVDGPRPGDLPPFLPMRGLPYALQRLVLRLRLKPDQRIVGKSHEVLGTWKTVPARRLVGKLLTLIRPRFRNIELCVPDRHAPAFLRLFRERLDSGDIRLPLQQGVGIRFTAHPPTGRKFVWVETSSRNEEQLHGLVELARKVCGETFWLHRGKYVPPGTAARHLYIPRFVDVSEAVAVPSQSAVPADQA